jgi:hypothetical protein
VGESSALFNDDFCMTSNNVDSDEAMRSVKRFIASIFKKRLTLHHFIATFFYSALNVSSALLFKENRR